MDYIHHPNLHKTPTGLLTFIFLFITIFLNRIERNDLTMDFNVFLRDLISSIDFFLYDVIVWLSQFIPWLTL